METSNVRLLRVIRRINEGLEKIMPLLGERFGAQSYDEETHLWLWQMEKLPDGIDGIEFPSDFFTPNTTGSHAEDTDIWHRYRRSCMHVFAHRLLAMLLQRIKCDSLCVNGVERTIRRIGVVAFDVALPFAGCPRVKHPPTGDAKVDSYVLPLYGRRVQWRIEESLVTFRHSMVVVEYVCDDDSTTTPYVYIDLCPHRLGVSMYDTKPDDAVTEFFNLPLFMFTANDKTSSDNGVHKLMLAGGRPRVFWCDEPDIWKTLVAQVDDERSPIEVCYNTEATNDDTTFEKCLENFDFALQQ